MKKKKVVSGAYKTLKEARAVAREKSTYGPVDVYQEPNGTYSVSKPLNNNAVFVVAIDKSGAKFNKTNKKDCYGCTIYVPVKQKVKNNKFIGEYETLVDVERVVRREAYNRSYIAVYKEPDGSYSIHRSIHENALLVFYMDRFNRRYNKIVQYDCYGNKKTFYKEII